MIFLLIIIISLFLTHKIITTLIIKNDYIACGCDDGKQIVCDEEYNPLGPGICVDNCDCSENRICYRGMCRNIGGGYCASDELSSNNANICNTDCRKADTRLTWTGQWQGITNKQCYSPNNTGSICGCYLPCVCENGQQVECDDTFNPLGKARCNKNCDCPIGKECSSAGYCQDEICCQNCSEDFLNCYYGCSEESPYEQPGCLLSCEAMFSVCKNNCGGCPDPSIKSKSKH